MDATLSQLLESIALTPTGDLQSLSGGDIAAVYRLETRQGQVVIKHDDATQLRGEAEGLRALRSASAQ
ncbi:MAG: fructosamine kinase family protein, partial [Halomonas sp.]